jgi:hypothetical protein
VGHEILLQNPEWTASLGNNSSFLYEDRLREGRLLEVRLSIQLRKIEVSCEILKRQRSESARSIATPP